MDNIQLLHGDCLEIMKDIPDGAIDMILCDLPYGILNKANSHSKCDCIIPFEPLWKQYKRITKPNAAIVLFAQGMFTAKLMMSNPKWWRYNLIWNKVLKSGFLNAKRQPLRQHEDICVFSSGQVKYNPQMIKCSPKERNHGRGKMEKQRNNCYGSYANVQTILSDEKYPASIISIQKKHSNGNFFHPTEKPVPLLEYLINTYSDEGDIVLDNAAGSMSTAIAAINTNRECICIEKDDNFFKVGSERVDKRLKEMKEDLFNG